MEIPGGKLTVVGQVYHQIEGDQPTGVEISYGRKLKSGEQPYGPRRHNVTEQWLPVDLGWLKGLPVGMVVMEHEGAAGPPTVQPQPDQKLLDESRLVVVALAPPAHDLSKRTVLDPPPPNVPPQEMFLLGAGESVPFRPCDASRLIMRTTEGKARVKVTVFAE